MFFHYLIRAHQEFSIIPIDYDNNFFCINYGAINVLCMHTSQFPDNSWGKFLSTIDLMLKNNHINKDNEFVLLDKISEKFLNKLQTKYRKLIQLTESHNINNSSDTWINQYSEELEKLPGRINYMMNTTKNHKNNLMIIVKFFYNESIKIQTRQKHTISITIDNIEFGQLEISTILLELYFKKGLTIEDFPELFADLQLKNSDNADERSKYYSKLTKYTVSLTITQITKCILTLFVNNENYTNVMNLLFKYLNEIQSNNQQFKIKLINYFRIMQIILDDATAQRTNNNQLNQPIALDVNLNLLIMEKQLKQIV
jgi:hypothetical protein